MNPLSPSHPRPGVVRRLLASLASTMLVAASLTVATASAAAPPTGCQLQSANGVKHVIYLQFDNVHFLGTTRTSRPTSSRCLTS